MGFLRKNGDWSFYHYMSNQTRYLVMLVDFI